MFIPEWLLWTAATLIVLVIANRVSRPAGAYDFVSGLFGFGVILTYIAFVVGYLIG